MSEESVVRSPASAPPLPRLQSQLAEAGVRPDSAQGQNVRYSVAAPLYDLATWSQSQIFDVAAAAAVAYDAATFPHHDYPDLVFGPPEVVPSGMTPPERFIP
jgi:hypothetical protein